MGPHHATRTGPFQDEGGRLIAGGLKIMQKGPSPSPRRKYRDEILMTPNKLDEATHLKI